MNKQYYLMHAIGLSVLAICTTILEIAGKDPELMWIGLFVWVFKILFIGFDSDVEVELDLEDNEELEELIQKIARKELKAVIESKSEESTDGFLDAYKDHLKDKLGKDV